jgi:16S rRNA (uracil1498-N3)-methyltransferase
MKCPRLFISPEEFSGDRVSFSPKDARYLYKVLRLRVGDSVEICDGTQDFLVRLTACNRDAVAGTVIESGSLAKPEEVEIILGFSTVRPGPVQEILRHGTELGVTRFVPILSCRANRRPFEKKQRWETVVASASAQSGRSILPEIEVPVTFEKFIQREGREELRLLLSTGPEATPILKVLEERAPRKVMILAGPEGGLDVSEVKKAIDVGFEPVSLGRGVLRSETAAVLAAGMVGLWYDWLKFRCTPPDELDGK